MGKKSTSLQVRIPESLKELTVSFDACWGNFVAELPKLPTKNTEGKRVRANITPAARTLKSFEELRKELGLSQSDLASRVLAAGHAAMSAGENAGESQ